MAAFKFTGLFEYLSGESTSALRRKAGWSETVYSSTNTDVVREKFRELLQARANLLPSGSGCIGGRVQQVEPTGSSQTFTVNYPGAGGAVNAPDIPQAALLIRARAAGVANVRSMRLAALPDAQITNGEYKPTSGFRGNMDAYLLRLNFFQMRGTDLSNVRVDVVTISAGGLMTTLTNHGLAAGNMVRIYDTRTTANVSVNGLFRVVDTPSLTTANLAFWTAGSCSTGKMRKIVIIFPQIVVTSDDISRMVTRKVGRPFGGYVGRQSTRSR